jgi:hypothetical protein
MSNQYPRALDIARPFRRHVNARVGLVDSHNIDGDVRSKNLAVSAIGCNTV